MMQVICNVNKKIWDVCASQLDGFRENGQFKMLVFIDSSGIVTFY
jgi:hypothetical protein